MTIKKFYKGFSTRHYHENGGDLGIYNVECVTEDLLNHIFTIRGERVHMPAWGTRIPEMVFEINDTNAQAVIDADLRTVFNQDPRVELLGLDVLPAEDINALVAIAKLRYLEFNVTK